MEEIAREKKRIMRKWDKKRKAVDTDELVGREWIENTKIWSRSSNRLKKHMHEDINCSSQYLLEDTIVRESH